MQLRENIRSVLIDYSGSNFNSSAVRNKVAVEIDLAIRKEVEQYLHYQNQELTKELLTKANRIQELERAISNKCK